LATALPVLAALGEDAGAEFFASFKFGVVVGCGPLRDVVFFPTDAAWGHAAYNGAGFAAWGHAAISINLTTCVLH
jgi:hypothetical protein